MSKRYQPPDPDHLWGIKKREWVLRKKDYCYHCGGDQWMSWQVGIEPDFSGECPFCSPHSTGGPSPAFIDDRPWIEVCCTCFAEKKVVKAPYSHYQIGTAMDEASRLNIGQLERRLLFGSPHLDFWVT